MSTAFSPPSWPASPRHDSWCPVWPRRSGLCRSFCTWCSPCRQHCGSRRSSRTSRASCRLDSCCSRVSSTSSVSKPLLLPHMTRSCVQRLGTCCTGSVSARIVVYVVSISWASCIYSERVTWSRGPAWRVTLTYLMNITWPSYSSHLVYKRANSRRWLVE